MRHTSELLFARSLRPLLISPSVSRHGASASLLRCLDRLSSHRPSTKNTLVRNCSFFETRSGGNVSSKKFTVMDSPRDGPGQTQRQRRWHQAPSRDAQATSRRLDSPAFAPNAQLPQAPITGTASDHLSLSGHAFSPDSSQWTTGRDGLLPQNTTWLPSSPNEEVMLPSLSETRLLSQLPFGLQTRDSGYVPALPTIAMSSGVVGGASAGAVNQASALHPPYPQSGSMSHSSNSSNASQPSFRFYGSHAWQASNFTNVYQFPERRWRRVYDRGSPNFQPSSRRYSLGHPYRTARQASSAETFIRTLLKTTSISSVKTHSNTSILSRHTKLPTASGNIRSPNAGSHTQRKPPPAACPS